MKLLAYFTESNAMQAHPVSLQLVRMHHAEQ